MNGTVAPTTKKRTGLLESAMLKLFTRKAKISNIEDAGTAFRIITLSGDALRNIRWTPGDKIQFSLGGWVQRTYTPLEWDSDAGLMRILICLHSAGPGARWARNLHVGDECIVFGPRTSLDVSKAVGIRVVIGDETSIGLACALTRWLPAGSLRSLFEVNSVKNTQEALVRLDLSGIELFERKENDTHIDEIEERLSAFVTAGATFLLTGKASSIQRLRRALQALGIPKSNLIVKPYWARGKNGLD